MTSANSFDERRPLLPSSSSSESPLSGSKAPFRHRCKTHFSRSLEHESATLPLAIQCLITGVVASVFISANGIWMPFITGTIIQLTNNLTYFLLPPSARAHLPYPPHTIELATSISMLMFGSFVSGRITTAFGTSKRGKFVGTALLQAAITLSACAMMKMGAWNGGFESGSGPRMFPVPAIGAVAFTMGLQAASSAAFASDAFATTAAFTAGLVHVVAFPFHQQTPLRATGIGALILGAGAGNLMVDLPRALLWIGLLELVLAGAWSWVE